MATAEQYSLEAREKLLRPGVAVTWTSSDDDIPEGSVGVIIEINDDGKRKIRWPKGVWNVAPEGLLVATTEQAEGRSVDL